MIAAALEAIPPVRRRMLAQWAVALVLGAGVFTLADYATRTLPRPAPLEELSYYPSGEHLESAALGHGDTAADLAWIRAVQYYGEHRRIDNRFDHLFHIFDILTTLAPRFEGAYVFGAFALAQEGRDFPQAEQLLLKGLDRNPRSGWLAFETGFLYYVKPNGRDLPHAAEYFELASRLPGAPPVAREFAAFAHQNTGGLAVAYQLWEGVRDVTHNRYLRELAEKEMARIRLALQTGRDDLVRVKLDPAGPHGPEPVKSQFPRVGGGMQLAVKNALQIPPGPVDSGTGSRSGSSLVAPLSRSQTDRPWFVKSSMPDRTRNAFRE